MGNKLYRVPGELISTDAEANAADSEDNVPRRTQTKKPEDWQKLSSSGDETSSDNSSLSSSNSEFSNFSFSSKKMFDGYAEFMYNS